MKKKVIALALSLLFPLIPKLNAQKVYSLHECQIRALQSSKELKRSELDITVAKAANMDMKMNYFPIASINAGYLHLQDKIRLVDFDALLGKYSVFIPDQINQLVSPDIRNIWVGNISLIQPILMGGKIVNGNKATQEAISLREKIAITKRNETLLSVEETYWQIISLSSKKKLLEKYSQLLDEMVTNVDALIASGFATKADGLTARLKRSEIDLKLTKVIDGLSLSKMLLKEKCGMPTDEDICLADEGKDSLALNIEVDPTLMDNNRTDSEIEARSEIKSLESLKTITNLKHKIALSEALPSITFIANYTLMNPNLHNGFQKKFHGGYSLGIGIQIPLTGIIRTSFKRNETKAETLSAELHLDDTKEKIRLQINQARFQMKEAYKQLDQAKANKDRANENLRYAKVGFDEGVIPLINLSQAQTAWLAAQDAYIDAQIGIKLAEMKLKFATASIKAPSSLQK